MEWYEWAIIVVFALLLWGRQLFQEAVGYLCPRCKQKRCRFWQATNVFRHYRGPTVWHYSCRRCGAEFYQSGGDPPKETPDLPPDHKAILRYWRNQMTTSNESIAFQRGIQPLLDLLLTEKAEQVAAFAGNPALPFRIEELATKCSEGNLTENEEASTQVMFAPISCCHPSASCSTDSFKSKVTLDPLATPASAGGWGEPNVSGFSHFNSMAKADDRFATPPPAKAGG